MLAYTAICMISSFFVSWVTSDSDSCSQPIGWWAKSWGQRGRSKPCKLGHTITLDHVCVCVCPTPLCRIISTMSPFRRSVCVVVRVLLLLVYGLMIYTWVCFVGLNKNLFSFTARPSQGSRTLTASMTIFQAKQHWEHVVSIYICLWLSWHSAVH